MTLIGTDTELMLWHTDTSSFISSEGLIGGTKDSPLPIEGGHVQEDNVTTEFNISPVELYNNAAFISSIKAIQKSVSKKVKSLGLLPYVVSSATFNEDMLMSSQAKTSGCSPDINVYTLLENKYPALTGNIRWAGGHIHLGNKEIAKNKLSLHKLVKILDRTVGVPLSILDNLSDRRMLYGKAGCFRYKPYGVEYRTPSNVWLLTEESILLMLKGTQLALDVFYEDASIDNIRDSDIQHGIESGSSSDLTNLIPEVLQPYVRDAMISIETKGDTIWDY